jgi:hypothetical protein
MYRIFHVTSFIETKCYIYGAPGRVVVMAPCYKSEGRGFETRLDE